MIEEPTNYSSTICSHVSHAWIKIFVSTLPLLDRPCTAQSDMGLFPAFMQTSLSSPRDDFLQWYIKRHGPRGFDALLCF